MHKSFPNWYEGPKPLVLDLRILLLTIVATYHDSVNGGVDLASEDSDPGLGVDCCCGSENFDRALRCL